MIRKETKGLRLRRPPEKARGLTVLTVLLWTSVLWAAARLTGMERPWLPAAAGAAVCGGVLLGKKWKWLPGVALGLLVLSLALFRDTLTDGFCQWYNGMAARYTGLQGTVLPRLEATDDPGARTAFALWAGAAGGLAGAALSRLGRGATALTAMAVCAGTALAMGEMTDPLPLLLGAAALCGGRSRKRELLLVGVLAAATVLSLLPGVGGWAAGTGEAIRQQAHVHQYETRYTTLPEGRLEPLGNSDAAALVVTMEKPEVLYLRGFTGAALTEEGWEPLDNEILAEHESLLYWLNSREFDLRAQFEAAAQVLDTGENSVTVQNLAACSAYRYIPFTVRSDGELIPENLTETAAGDRYDSFTTVYGGAALLPELLEALAETDSRYLQAEGAYREFVRAYYLQVPEAYAELLRPYWDAAEGLEPQAAVKAVLESCYPNGLPNDPYGATAAVLTLRHFGIPARYAEGYITPQTTATTVELTGQHAACWAEVYHEGVGWMPMALTPGLEGEQEQQNQEPLPPDPPQETEPPETEPETEPEPEGGTQVRIPRALVSGALMGLLLLVLAALALVLRRRAVLKKRQAVLSQADVRETVLVGFAEGVSALERLGIHRGKGSLDAMTGPVAERFGDSFGEAFGTASGIHARALFSSHLMTEQERQTVNRFRAAALGHLKDNSKGLRKLWMQYILCLF